MSGADTTAARRVWLPNVAAWLALMTLLALTLGSSYLPLGGALNTIANLAIALLKVGIVAVVFMGLRRDDDSLLRLAAAAAFFWLLILFALTLADFLTRPA